MKEELIKQLTEAGTHYGYSKTRRHPSMKKFIANTSKGNDFINTEVTATQLEKALEKIQETVRSGKQVLFVGEKPEVRQIVREIALSVGEPYMTDRFVAGTITNFVEIRKRAEKLSDMLSKKEKGEYSMYTKKEQLMIQRSIDRMDRNFGGILSMNRLPGLVIVIDPRHDNIAVEEANFAHIETVALASTDCDISNITYPIIGNDATSSSVRFILTKISEAIKTTSENKTETVKTN